MNQRTESQLDPLQQFVLDNYVRGEFAHLTNPDEVEGCGDTLLSFLIREISTGEDCEDGDDAVRRLQNAARELLDLAEAFERDFDKTASPKP